MKILGLIAGVGLLLGGPLLEAQTYAAGTTAGGSTGSKGVVLGQMTALNDYGSYDSVPYDKATNAVQGIDYGIAKIIRAEGEYLLHGSQAAINWTEAQRREMANWNTWVHTLYETQRYAKEARAAERGPAPSQAEILRMAQIGKPRRLTPSEMDVITGQLAWPIALQDAQFAPYRRSVDQVFADRAYTGRLELGQYTEAERTIQYMIDQLREQILQFAPSDYITGRRFLESLAYEARPLSATPAPVAGTTTLRR